MGENLLTRGAGFVDFDNIKSGENRPTGREASGLPCAQGI